MASDTLLRPDRKASSSSLPGHIQVIPPLDEGEGDNSLASLRVPFPSEDDDETTEKQKEVISARESGLTNSSSQQTNSDKLTDLPTSPPVSASPRFRSLNRSLRISHDKGETVPSAHSDGDLPRNTISGTSSSSFGHSARYGRSRRDSLSATAPRASTSEGSISSIGEHIKNKANESFTNIRQALPRKNRLSDPGVASSPSLAALLHLEVSDPKKQDSPKLAPPNTKASSQPHSRASSPLRVLQQWSAALHRPHTKEEPFVPVNPFKFNTQFRWPFSSDRPPHLHETASQAHDMTTRQDISEDDVYCCCLPAPVTCSPHDKHNRAFESFTFFMTDTMPRQIYLYTLLRIPALYFSRVSRIFEDAEVSKPDIERIIDSFRYRYQSTAASPVPPSGRPTDNLTHGIASAIGHSAHIGSVPLTNTPLPFPDDWSPPLVSTALIRFRQSWETFIDSLLREWKTLNLVSALLLSAILTVFQIPAAASDPVTRNTALVSLTCALMSLSYGCVYIVRFGTMRSMARASRWAEEARKNNTLIWWNVWVMLAMPAVWLAWAMIWFIATILSFVWRTGSENDPEERPPLTVQTALIPRILITAVFLVGIIYFALIVKTLKGYGTSGYGPQHKWRVLARMSLDSDARVAAGRNVNGLGISGPGVGDGSYFSPGSSPRSVGFELDDLVPDSARRGRRPTRGTPTSTGHNRTSGQKTSSIVTGHGGGVMRSPIQAELGKGVSMQRDEKSSMGLGISGIDNQK